MCRRLLLKYSVLVSAIVKNQSGLQLDMIMHLGKLHLKTVIYIKYFSNRMVI